MRARIGSAQQQTVGSGSQRRALRLVARRAEDLKVLDGVRAAHREGDDVVVLDLEVRTTLDAVSAIAFEHGLSNFPRNRLTASCRWRRAGCHHGVCVVELALRA